MASKGLNKVINGVAAARIWQKTNQLADLDSDLRAAVERNCGLMHCVVLRHRKFIFN